MPLAWPGSAGPVLRELQTRHSDRSCGVRNAPFALCAGKGKSKLIRGLHVTAITELQQDRRIKLHVHLPLCSRASLWPGVRAGISLAGLSLRNVKYYSCLQAPRQDRPYCRVPEGWLPIHFQRPLEINNNSDHASKFLPVPQCPYRRDSLALAGWFSVPSCPVYCQNYSFPFKKSDIFKMYVLLTSHHVTAVPVGPRPAQGWGGLGMAGRAGMILCTSQAIFLVFSQDNVSLFTPTLVHCRPGFRACYVLIPRHFSGNCYPASRFLSCICAFQQFLQGVEIGFSPISFIYFFSQSSYFNIEFPPCSAASLAALFLLEEPQLEWSRCSSVPAESRSV